MQCQRHRHDCPGKEEVRQGSSGAVARLASEGRSKGPLEELGSSSGRMSHCLTFTCAPQATVAFGYSPVVLRLLPLPGEVPPRKITCCTTPRNILAPGCSTGSSASGVLRVCGTVPPLETCWPQDVQLLPLLYLCCERAGPCVPRQSGAWQCQESVLRYLPREDLSQGVCEGPCAQAVR